ncbi:MAG: LD-carboxypeptidase [Bacteroidales bacterium]|nr:LD-carboxypeptidase [Bacteroidales bacterium]
MRPPLLKKGDLVALAATARKVAPEEVQAAVALLESWGLRVLVPEGLFAADNQMAGSDEHRRDLLQQLLDNEAVCAIVCCRGGYGTVRIVDALDFSRFAANPKWIVGYSDVTVLHSHLAARIGIASLHATMPLNIPADALSAHYASIDTMHQLLFDGSASYSFDNRTAATNRTGEANGTVVGGNLSILYSLLASPSDIDTSGKILLIEDLDEYLYHIDRMMMALKRAGKLSGLKGLIVGALNDMHDNAIPFGRDAEQIVRDAVAEYGYPVAFGAPIGHIGTDNHAVVLGGHYTLKVAQDSATLAC